MSLPFAMHMDNVLLDPSMAAITLVIAGGMLVLASLRTRRQFSPEKVPLMGVLGAFVFAAQMINFPLPALGTSGHFGGGALLAIVLGPWAATLVMAAILIVQCLIFQDGGLLALGCNIINMGIVPSFLGYVLYRLIAGRPAHAAGWRIYVGAWLASLIGLVAGAMLVPIEVRLAGVLTIPTATFASAMLTLHVPIGTVEGLITFAVICFLYQANPALLGLPDGQGRKIRAGRKAVLATLLVAAVIIAGAISWFASTISDGLETAFAPRYSHSEQPLRNPSNLAAADRLVERVALLPDYGKREVPLGQVAEPAADAAHEQAAPPSRISGWTTLAGLTGTVVTILAIYIISLFLRRRPARTDAGTTVS